MIGRGRKDGDAARRPDFRPRLWLGLAAALVAAAGCRSNNKSALVEAELRTREREIRTMRSDLERAETYNSALQSELLNRSYDCVGLPAAPGGGLVDGTQAVMAGLVKNVVLGRGTGGIDDDGVPGDEALQIVIVPQDVDGSAVKVPGTAAVTAYEITPEGLKVPLSRWEVPALKLQHAWRSGLFTTGYFVNLPWKTWPTTGKLRVVVQFFTLPSNRPFEAERDVTVKLAAGAPARPPVAPMLEPCLPGEREALPPGFEGPLIFPGAGRRETGTNPDRIEAAKIGLPHSARQPVRLMAPSSPTADEPAADRP